MEILKKNDMKERNIANQYIYGSSCGIAGTACYIAIITINFHPAVTFFLAVAWPILSIIFALSLYKYIDSVKPGFSNQLAFLFTCIAFILVALMVSIQITLNSGIDEQMLGLPGTDQQALSELKYTLRWIDLGIDLAWDMFLGAGLIFLSIALIKVKGFGMIWYIPAFLLVSR